VGDKGAQFFKQSFELKIKGDMIPESAVESIIRELQDLFARHEARAALSAMAVFKATKDFHTVRHTGCLRAKSP
jgi:20S proteasome alpha/beta subunit